MQDNPFAEPDHGDRTVIRPNPGGRRTAAQPPAPDATEMTRIVQPAPARMLPGEISGAADFATAPVANAAPLVAAASTLLQLLARLRNTLTAPDAGDLRERTGQEVRAFAERARAAGVPPHLLRPAHYALCASLDDVVLNTPWGSGSSWDSCSLVSTFHQEVRGGERFFDILDLARKTPDRFQPVLEVMYLCLSLGFRGRYRLSPRGPAEVDALREQVHALLVAGRSGGEKELSPAWRGVAAPYRPSRPRLPIWVAGTVALTAVAGLFIWSGATLNAASDSVYESALLVPPAIMPTIARAAPPSQVVAAPIPQDADVLARLRRFLQPEIDAGAVEVLGTQSAPVVRVRQHGLFGSGSASVQASAVPLLERIGAALKDEPGAVQVVGYTDNAPIRTVRFPSNFQLSAARADAARAIVGHMIGDPARLSFEGRADADPIASNTTPEGRDANRRIEIVLRRQA